MHSIIALQRLPNAIAVMPRGSFVDGAVAGLVGLVMAWFCVTSGVTLMREELPHMIGRIVCFVLTGRDAVTDSLRSSALGSAIGMRHHAGHHQPIPVLHGGVADIAKLGLPPAALR